MIILTSALSGEAQHQTAKVARVGVLMFTDMNEVFRDAFRRGLRDHGYVEGQNMVIEWRAADDSRDRARALAADLVRLKVDVIVATLVPAVQAAKEATDSIPIVMAPAADPIGQGFVASLARPGRNITGLTGITTELSGKRLQLLQEMIPNLRRVAVLVASADPVATSFAHEHEAPARKAGILLHVEAVPRSGEGDAAFAAVAKQGAGAVIVQPILAVPAAQASRVARLALRHRLPSISQSGEFATAGGLLSYGSDFTHLYGRAAAYVDRLLKGAKPGDLPVEQVTRLELVVNLKTAKALGVVVPPSLLLQANKVIE